MEHFLTAASFGTPSATKDGAKARKLVLGLTSSKSESQNQAKCRRIVVNICTHRF